MTREVDLIEEVVRHHGLDKFPPRLHASKQPAARLPHAEAEDRLRERLIGLGYQEIVNIPLANEGEDALFRPDECRAGARDQSACRRRISAAFDWTRQHG